MTPKDVTQNRFAQLLFLDFQTIGFLSCDLDRIEELSRTFEHRSLFRGGQSCRVQNLRPIPDDDVFIDELGLSGMLFGRFVFDDHFLNLLRLRRRRRCGGEHVLIRIMRPCLGWIGRRNLADERDDFLKLFFEKEQRRHRAGFGEALAVDLEIGDSLDAASRQE